MLLTVVALVLAAAVNAADVSLPKVTKGDLRVGTFALGGMLVDEEKKFMFCPIEKIASTQFKQLFFRLNGDPLWFEPPYHKKDSPRLGHFSKERALEMLTSPEWIRAVIFRDPAKRLLSSFVHLVLNPKTPPRYRTALSDRHKNLTWPDFVDAVLEKDGYDNIHWTPQSNFCGLRRFYPLLNFVGNFEQLNEHGMLLNERAGLEAATSSGWGKCAFIKSPIHVGSTPESRSRVYVKLLKKYTAKNRTDDCMWCKNLALHKNNYEKHGGATALLAKGAHRMGHGGNLQETLRQRLERSAVFSPDYDMFRLLSERGVRPFNFSQYH